MTVVCKYATPDGLDDLLMVSDGKVLTGLHFIDSRKVVDGYRVCAEHDLPVFRETRGWLGCYFSGRQPDFTPPYRIDGLTPFRKDVTDAMLAIHFGQTTTYGSIAAAIARKHNLAKMSAQAVGGAVGWNPICIIIPCHRVIGAGGALVGYGGGLTNKVALLAHERRHAMEG